jgi:ankyrin repeat protein
MIPYLNRLGAASRRVFLIHFAVVLAFSQGSDTAELNAALLTQATRGNVEAVRQLLDKGADANARSKGGLTALMCGVSSGSDEIVQLLLRAGADPNTRDSRGFPALHLAVSLGKAPLVPILLDHGAEVNAVNSAGATALSLAVIAKSIPLAKLLIEGGANVNPKGVNSSMQPLFLANKSGQTAMARVLRTAGAR